MHDRVRHALHSPYPHVVSITVRAMHRTLQCTLYKYLRNFLLLEKKQVKAVVTDLLLLNILFFYEIIFNFTYFINDKCPNKPLKSQKYLEYI